MKPCLLNSSVTCVCLGWGCSGSWWELWSSTLWVTEELLSPQCVLVGHRFPGGRAISQCTVNCRAGVCAEDTADEPLQSSKSKYCLAAEVGVGVKTLNHPNQIVSTVWPGSGGFSFFFIFFFLPVEHGKLIWFGERASVSGLNSCWYISSGTKFQMKELTPSPPQIYWG